jgi:hypothetical protein
MRLLRRILATYESGRSALEIEPDEQEFTLELPDERLPGLYARYRARRRAWEARHGERIDRYFRNYCLDLWVKEWYTDAPSLLVHTQRMLVRVAALRFLLFGHPALWDEAPALEDGEEVPPLAGPGRAGDGGTPDGGPSAPDAPDVLDRAAVEVFQAFSKNIEHNALLLEVLRTQLEPLHTLPFLTALARF